jgi:hypothetical protein
MMNNSTYNLTLATDGILYRLYREGNHNSLCMRASQLYVRYHSEDNLTVAVRVTTLAEVCTQWQTALDEGRYGN